MSASPGQLALLNGRWRIVTRGSLSGWEASKLLQRLESLDEIGDAKAMTEIRKLRDAASAGRSGSDILAVPPIERAAGEFHGHKVNVRFDAESVTGEVVNLRTSAVVFAATQSFSESGGDIGAGWTSAMNAMRRRCRLWIMENRTRNEL